jgi:hypothetical protein
MADREQVARTLRHLLPREGCVAVHCETLLEAVEDPRLKLARVALRQDVNRRTGMIQELLGTLGG